MFTPDPARLDALAVKLTADSEALEIACKRAKRRADVYETVGGEIKEVAPYD